MKRRPLILIAALAAVSLFALWTGFLSVDVRIGRQTGWSGPELARVAYQEMQAQLPKYSIPEAEQNDPNARAVLWEAARFFGDGRHIPTMQQPSQDCVGASSAQAVQYLMAQTGHYKPIFPPYQFACGRNAPECGNGIFRNDPRGSIGAWQALAVQLYGVLPTDFPGLPPYDQRNTEAWAIRMPAPQYITAGREHPVKTIARVTTPDEVRRAIQNYYVVTIASNWGGLDKPPLVDGMRLNRRAGTWKHQMLVIGFQVRSGRRFWYVLNNWGADYHGPPAADEPPGGFWINETDMADIAGQGDSWAYSDAVGFPRRGLDWRIVRAKRTHPARLQASLN